MGAGRLDWPSPEGAEIPGQRYKVEASDLRRKTARVLNGVASGTQGSRQKFEVAVNANNLWKLFMKSDE